MTFKAFPLTSRSPSPGPQGKQRDAEAAESVLFWADGESWHSFSQVEFFQLLFAVAWGSQIGIAVFLLCFSRSSFGQLFRSPSHLASPPSF